MSFLLGFVQHGLIDLPWWGYVVFTLIMTHITILMVTIFLHRCQAHRALELHPALSHFFRFWCWMTTGMVTKEWAAIHRKHHAFADKEGDPHSPHVVGIKKVLREGVGLYQAESRNPETMEKYGSGTPDDWMERHIYTKHSKLGVGIMLVIDLVLFGPIGLSIWAVQMMWIPVSAAGVINGIGHWFGYRNFPNPDHARNIVPFGFLIGGEELHNNHHTFATSAKFSYKWYEFDLGWMWIRIFQALGLAKVKRVSPVLPKSKTPKLVIDLHTLEIIISNRYNLMTRYARVLKRDCKHELARMQANINEKINWKRVKHILAKDDDMLTVEEQSLLKVLAKNSVLLQKVFALRADLTKVWQRSSLTKEELLVKLQNWCHKAEGSGIRNLQQYARRLRTSY